ncbi:MAG: alpha/beta-hydrolase family protein [Vicinamibacterales bacterium]|nr:alpha/beta-hydrolase family protein [Vicinamibacterales bacterium]
MTFVLRLITVWCARLSRIGLIVGVLFLALSLTPSLVPRPLIYQGLVSGLSLTLGYALGVAGRWLWAYLGLPQAGDRLARILTASGAVVGVAFLGLFIWQASEWQNSVRQLMHLPPASGVSPFSLAAVTLLAFGVLVSLARLFRQTFVIIAARFDRFLPQRVANVVGVAVSVALFWTILDGILIAAALRFADGVSQQVDASTPVDLEPPADPQRTGSRESHVAWEDLGRQGREFVSTGPTAADLRAFFGYETPTPIRVYVGLNAAETPDARARLALRELERVGAFDRAVLLLVTPTGTGWVDPAALSPVEYLHRGDIASVAVQYSYLPSVIALPTEGAYGAENARALFQAVYGHWTRLPKERRPALYLYGVSLGALNSERSFDVHDIIADPFRGILLTGPPFRSELRHLLTSDRRPDSPAWRPRFRDGSVVRFMNQQGGLEVGDAPWGPFRIAFLQYASDPMTFFSVRSLFVEPDWMRGPRAPDVSPALRWYPVVSTVQLAADMAVANAPPPGYGHNFAAEHYVDAWRALMEPDGWTASEVRRLKTLHASMP